jgi:hypothetical protein
MRNDRLNLILEGLCRAYKTMNEPSIKEFERAQSRQAIPFYLRELCAYFNKEGRFNG